MIEKPAQRRLHPVALALTALLALLVLAGCERPDPQDTAAQEPVGSPTPQPTATTAPTAQPLQLYVVIVQPTAEPQQPVAGVAPQVLVATPTPTVPPTLAFLEPSPTVAPTGLPENYYLGWVWANSLSPTEDRELVIADRLGLTMRDRPSGDGRQVGLVIGYADLFVAGESRCGYTPVLVHANNLISVDTPPPAIDPPRPLPTERPPFLPTPTPQFNTLSGWVFTEELTVIGQTAIAGALGVNLRSDPCRFARNLGFIPAGANLIVTGLPSGEYTPIRVHKDVVQLPYSGPSAPVGPAVLATPPPLITLPEGLTATPTMTATIALTVTLTPEIQPTPIVEPTPTPEE